MKNHITYFAIGIMSYLFINSNHNNLIAQCPRQSIIYCICNNVFFFFVMKLSLEIIDIKQKQKKNKKKYDEDFFPQT